MKKPLILAAIVIVAATLFAVVSCQKEEEGSETSQNTLVSSRDAEILSRIKDFKGKVEYYSNHPDERDVYYLSVEESVWNLEALFNYTFAYPDSCYGRTVVADTTLHLTLSTNDSVSLPNLASFYGDMHTAIQTLYHKVDLPDKQFVILDVEEGTHQNGNVEILLHTIQGSVMGSFLGLLPTSETGPFQGDTLWSYGGLLGTIPVSTETDASVVLSMVLNEEFSPVPPEGYSYVYTNVVIKTTNEQSVIPFSHPLYPDLGPYCEFRKDNPGSTDIWLDADQMNFHYFGEKYLVTDFLPYTNPNVQPFDVLFIVAIQSYSNNNGIGHVTSASYGVQSLQGSSEREKEILN